MGGHQRFYRGEVMALSNFSFLARSISELHSWFVDIVNHLSAKNYDNGDWIPVITGMTGSPAPTVTAWYQRFGIECNFTIIIDGTHTMANSEISLPITPNGPGVALMHSMTDNSTIGTAYIDESDSLLHIKTYFVESEKVVIRGFYKVAGI